MVAALAAVSGAAPAQTWDGAGGRPVMPDAAQLRFLPGPAPEAGFAAAVKEADGTAKSAEELSFPEYCRINDKDLTALAEDVMTKDSPRDPATGNLFIELAAAGPGGRQLKARVVNVRHAHPGDQFHIELYVGGNLLFKSGRQDNPIFIGFQVDGEPFSLACFEDIPQKSRSLTIFPSTQ